MDASQISTCLDECTGHLTDELLPFWLDRCLDREHGGIITHFDRDGRDTGEDEKSMLAQMRTIYAMASAHRAGYGNGRCAEYAGRAGDVPARVVVPWMYRHRDPACGLRTEHEGRERRLAAGAGELCGSEDRRPDRCRRMQHRREMRVVVILQVTEVAVDERGGARRRLEIGTDDRRARRATLGSCPVDQNPCVA